VRCVVVVALVGSCIHAGLAEAGSRRNKPPGPPRDVPGHVNYLVRQLYGVQLADAGDIADQVQDLVIHALTAWMSGDGFQKESNSYPVDVRVRKQLEHYFSELRYPFFGSPVVFSKSWNGGELIGAGYTLGWSDFDRVNVFALFDSKDGKTGRVALTHFFPGPDMHYAFLPQTSSGAFRFMVYGNRLGKSQPRLSAALYSFDGQKLSNLWRQKDLYDGKMNVTGETVTLRYLLESQYVQATQQGQLPPWHEDIYQVTPQGLTLQTERLLPYKSTS
jgi:hypothetical protein